MQKSLLAKLKEKLEREKFLIETELKKIAKQDQKLKGDWDTEYPSFNGGAGRLEEEADEVQEYVNLLAVEYSLESRLQKINSALERIKKGAYGKCKKCKKEISIERLKVCPEAEFCNKCSKK